MESSLKLKKPQDQVMELLLKKQVWNLDRRKFECPSEHLLGVTLGKFLKLSKLKFPYCKMKIII